MKRYYYIEPKYFKDSSNTGTGDLRGICEKINVIKKNLVDTLIIPNNLSIYKSSIIEEMISNEIAYGSFDDFKDLINKLKAENINLFLEFKLSDLENDLNSFLNLQKRIEINTSNYNIQDFEIEKTESYYISKNDYTKTENDSLEAKIIALKDIWNFYLELGINGFIFVFDANKKLLKKGKVYDSLKSLYSNIHSNLTNVEIIYKISDTNYSIFKKQKNKLFDELLIYKISNLNKKNITKVISNILLLDVIYNITFLNDKRIIQHFLPHQICNDEVAKMLLTILIFNNKKHLINYGDEIGLNLFNKFKPDFILDVFLKNYFNEENSKLVYPWTSGKNAGFSASDSIEGVIDECFKSSNLKVQRNQSNSVLEYFKFISYKFKTKAFPKSFQSKMKVKTYNNVLEISYQSDDNKLILIANISEYIISIKEIDSDCLIYSNWNLDLKRNKLTLNPYEALIYTDSSYNRDSYLEH